MLPDSNFGKNFIYTALYKTLLIITPLVTAPYLSRVLGPSGIGVQSYCQSIVSLFALFATLGISTYAERQIAYHRDSAAQSSIIFWNAKILTAILSSVTIAGYILFSLNSTNKVISLIFTLQLLDSAIDCTFVFHGFNDFGIVTLLTSIAKIMDVIFIFMFVHGPEDLGIHIYGTLLFPFIANLISLIFLKKYIHRIQRKEVKPFKNFKTVISLFIPTIATTIYSVLDKTMIGIICVDTAENGYYEQASKVVAMSAAVIGSIAIAGFPHISYYWKTKKSKELAETMSQSYKLVWLLSFPLMFGIMGIADNFVPWFFGQEYEKVSTLIKILSLITLPLGLCSVSGKQYLVASGKQNLYTISYTLCFIINFILNIFLIRKWSATGAAIASVISEFILALIQCFFVYKDQKSTSIFGVSWKYALSGLLMAFALMIENIYLVSSTSSTILMIFSGIVVYASSLIFLNDAFFISLLNFARKKIS